MHEERSENGSWCEDLFIRHRERQNGRRTTKNIIDERRSAFFCYYMAEDLGDGGEQLNACPDTADPEVDRDLPGPVGVLYGRDAVVVLVLTPGVRLGMVRGLELLFALLDAVLRRIAHLCPPNP